MKYLLLITFSLVLVSCQVHLTAETTQKKEIRQAEDKAAILAVMKAQEAAWSKNDLEGFMQGYWKSDSLKFFGSKGITYGWEQTLANYKKGYPTADHSGILTFKIHDISKIEHEAYWVMGEYFLKRTVGDANGIFMILFKKIDGEWKIVADMSC
ncbi:MAG: nuclear transport factor 2 family protein [Flavobacteriaceae bacterium]